MSDDSELRTDSVDDADGGRVIDFDARRRARGARLGDNPGDAGAGPDTVLLW